MASPLVANTVLPPVAVEFINAVVHKVSLRYDEATKNQEWIEEEMVRNSRFMGALNRKEIELSIAELESKRRDIKTGGLAGILTIRKYRKFRQYQKATEQVKKKIQMTPEQRKPRKLQATSGHDHVQTETQTEPPPVVQKPHVNFSFVHTSDALSDGPNVAMQATVEGDLDHLYIGTYTTQKSQTWEMLDPATGMYTPIFTENTVSRGLYRSDRSGPAAEEAGTIPQPNTLIIHARPETDAPTDAANKSDDVSSDASSGGASVDTPDVSVEFSENVQGVNLADWQEVGSYGIALGADSSLENNRS
ncbi:hypothetical protein FA95DRAFT_225382 [Auriscalpium vulgare]|uniref:Uncharacterized protein n=1 Tax=Auriscalpium vulgare TaxID=40419 RepID=A0ACB8RM68_9AGAM|nr:hypothetical protein FA95DRAFT_225382 [Auriscalpium vulgare]